MVIHSLEKISFDNPASLIAFLFSCHNHDCEQVFDEDIGEDDRMGVTKLSLNELESDTPKEIELRLLPKYDMLKIKDKKDRGTITIKVHTKNHSFCHEVPFLL